VLQCVAVCCSVLQYVAVCCSMLQYVAVCSSMLQYVAVCCSVLQYVAVCSSMQQYVAVCCSCVAVALQCVKSPARKACGGDGSDYFFGPCFFLNRSLFLCSKNDQKSPARSLIEKKRAQVARNASF